MQYYYSHYDLELKSFANSKLNTNKLQGLLVKVDFRGFAGIPSIGYSLYQARPQSGDPSLADFIQELRAYTSQDPLKPESNIKLSAYIQNAIELAKIDARARAKNISVFENLKIPKSHFLILDILSLNINEFEFLQESFKYFKIKMGRDLAAETKALKFLLEYAEESTKVRLDWNHSLSPSSFFHFIEQLNDKEARHIDFHEDPFAYDQDIWAHIIEEKKAKLCLDSFVRQQALEYLPKQSELIQNLNFCFKPACQEYNNIQNFLDLCSNSYYVSHNMDHPLGQSIAAYFAAKWAMDYPNRHLKCGLLAKDYMTNSDYLEQIQNNGPEFVPSNSAGFGFEESLNKEAWLEI